MISFRPSEDELSFVDVAKDFAKDSIRPKARECEDNHQVDEKTVKELTDIGLTTLELPESWGGLELPLISQVQVLQALAYGDLGTLQGIPGVGDAASLIRLLDDHQALGSYKERLTAENPTIALLDGSDPEMPWGSLTVEQVGSEYILHGTSQPIRLAEFADYIAVLATDQQGEDVILWLDQSEQAWQVEEGDYRLGLLSSGIAKLIFDHVKVGNSHVLASGKEATLLIKAVQSRVRVLQAAKQTGLMEAALDYATEYTAERKAFGQVIAKFQGVSFRIAKMAIETKIVNHLVWEAAVKIDEVDEAMESYSLRALYRAHRSVRYVTDSAVQLLGGHGFVQEFPVEKWMRDAQAQVALYGSERDLLTTYGEQLIAEKEEVAVT
ncbi:MAG TPA: acyl-CoA dehydrogenase family protein [Virgibacillus sp.]|nr:acyl-CoA dehydrogenase family protein [Virgibacillus sp.]